MFQFILITLLILVSVHHNHPEKSLMPELYYLSVEAKNIHTTVLLNDVPIIILDEGTGIVSKIPITTWLMPNTNSLQIVGKALPGSKIISGEVLVSIFQHDRKFDIPTVKKTYATLQYPQSITKQNQFEDSVKIDFEFNEIQDIRLWNQAQPILELQDKDKDEILNIVNQLGFAINNGEFDKAIFLQKYKIKEDSLAEGIKIEELEKVAKTNYEWLKSQKKINFLPHNIENLKFLIMGNEQIIKVITQSQKEVVRFESDDILFEIPVFVSKIKNKWTIVR